MRVGGQIHMTTAKVLTSLEVLPKGTSKGNGVKSLMRDMGIKMANVMAIGDGENDLEMLKAAGLGVAIGNADAVLKEVAQEVVGTNDEDGVAEAIERFVIGKPDPVSAVAPDDEAPTAEISATPVNTHADGEASSTVQQVSEQTSTTTPDDKPETSDI